MDTELRKNVPVSQVRKEDAEFGRAMEKARVMSEKLKAEKDKAARALRPQLMKETPKVKPGQKMGGGSF